MLKASFIIIKVIIFILFSGITIYTYSQENTKPDVKETINLTKPPIEVLTPLLPLLPPEEFDIPLLENEEVKQKQTPPEELDKNYITDVKVRYSLPNDHSLINIFTSLVTLSITTLNIVNSEHIPKTYGSIKNVFNEDTDIFIFTPDFFPANNWQQCVNYLNSSLPSNKDKATSFDVTKMWWNKNYLKSFINYAKKQHYTVIAILAEPVAILHYTTKQNLVNKSNKIVSEGWAWNDWSKAHNYNIVTDSIFSSWINGKVTSLNDNIFVSSWLRASSYSLLPISWKHVEYNDFYLPIFILANTSVFDKIPKDRFNALSARFGKSLSLLMSQLLDQSIDLEREKAIQLKHSVSSAVSQNNYLLSSESRCKNAK